MKVKDLRKVLEGMKDEDDVYVRVGKEDILNAITSVVTDEDLLTEFFSIMGKIEFLSAWFDMTTNVFLEARGKDTEGLVILYLGQTTDKSKYTGKK